MSTFGDNTFKQRAYEEIKWQMEVYQLSSVDAVQEILEICSYMLLDTTCDQTLREQIREDVRQEILLKIGD